MICFRFAFVAVLAGLASACSAPVQPLGLAFDTRLLDGWWSDNTDTSQACAKENPRIRYRFNFDGTRLQLEFDRKWNTEIGEADRFPARVIASTQRTLVIEYDNESRRDPMGRAVQWELAVVAPGVYRWRATEWPPGAVNVVVGIRCQG